MSSDRHTAGSKGNGRRSVLTWKNIGGAVMLIGFVSWLCASWYENKVALCEALQDQKDELEDKIAECRTLARDRTTSNDKRLTMLEYQVTNEFSWRDKQLDYRIQMLRLEVDLRHKKTVSLDKVPEPPRPTPAKKPPALMDVDFSPYLQKAGE